MSSKALQFNPLQMSTFCHFLWNYSIAWEDQSKTHRSSKKYQEPWIDHKSFSHWWLLMGKTKYLPCRLLPQTFPGHCPFTPSSSYCRYQLFFYWLLQDQISIISWFFQNMPLYQELTHISYYQILSYISTKLHFYSL